MLVLSTPLPTSAEQRQQSEGVRPLPCNGAGPVFPTSAARKQGSGPKKPSSTRVLARVLKEFLPVFSTAFECFSWPSMLMFSMSYVQKHFCHGRGRGFEPRRPRHTFSSSFG